MAVRRRGAGVTVPVDLMWLLAWRLVSGVFRVCWRAGFTVLPLTGKPPDNATIRHAATRDLTGRPVERLRGPLWRLLAARLALIGLPSLLTGWALVSAVAAPVFRVAGVDRPWWLSVPAAVLGWYLGALAVTGAGWAVAVAPSWWRGRETRSEWQEPAWQAVCGVLGLTFRRREARRNVLVPGGYEPTDVVDEPDPEPGAAVRLGRWVLSWFGLDPATRLLRAQREAEAASVGAGTGLTDLPAPIEPHRWRLLRRAAVAATADLDDAEPVKPDPVVVYLPPGKSVTTAQRKALLSTVGPVLGMTDPQAEWYPRGKRPYVELRPTIPPPPAVTWEMVRRHVEATELDRPVIGLGPGGRPGHLDYSGNSPHIAISGGSGTGKSVLLKFLLGQRMHLGTGLIVLDYKRVSHRWAHNLPGCVYAWRLADMHDLLVLVGEELERRLETVLPEDNDPDADMQVFQVVDIVLEEINSLSMMLRAYWAEIRQPGDPSESPAMMAVKRGVNMGREFGMHFHAAGQRLSASVFGSNGGDLRESFQERLLAKWTRQTWAMLAGGLPYQRFPPNVGRGVWGRVTEEGVELYRVPFLSNSEIRAWASSGAPSPEAPLSGELVSGLASRRAVRDTAAGHAAGAPPALVTLSAVLPQLPGAPMSLPALRQAAGRPGFPPASGEAGSAKTYELSAVLAWKRDKDARAGGGPGAAVARFDVASGRRPGRVYQFRVLDTETGAVVCGYVGQTFRTLAEREEEHRGDKPWSDLIVGSIQLVEEGEYTPDELDAAELGWIGRLMPLFNYEGQEGAAHAVPKWVQLDQRQERNTAAGLPPWEPVDVFASRRGYRRR